MLCYHDKTWCSFFKDCAIADDCDRKLTDAVKNAAVIARLPVCEFSEPPECHRKKDDG